MPLTAYGVILFYQWFSFPEKFNNKSADRQLYATHVIDINPLEFTNKMQSPYKPKLLPLHFVIRNFRSQAQYVT